MAEYKHVAPRVANTNPRTIRIRQVRSAIGHKYDQQRTLKALGIHRMHEAVDVVDNPGVRGMIFKVKHLLEVEELS